MRRVKVLTRGCYFGEISVIDDEVTASAHVVAESVVEVQALLKDQFLELMQGEPLRLARVGWVSAWCWWEIGDGKKGCSCAWVMEMGEVGERRKLVRVGKWNRGSTGCVGG